MRRDCSRGSSRWRRRPARRALRPPLKFHRDRPIEPGEAIDPGGQKDTGIDVTRSSAWASTSHESNRIVSALRPSAGRAPPALPGADDTLAVSSGDVPASPPPEVLEAMDAAGRVARELHATGRELRFVPPSDGAGGRVRMEVRDLDGNVLREIPPTELLDVATGAPLD